MYKVRKATREDIPKCLIKAEEFLKFWGDERLFDMKSLVLLFLNLMDKGIFLVVQKDEKICGVLGAVVFPHVFNSNLLFASELFWWVDEEERKGRAALLLFNTFMKEIEERKVDILAVTKLSDSGLSDRFFEKRGFALKEKGFYKCLPQQH